MRVPFLSLILLAGLCAAEKPAHPLLTPVESAPKEIGGLEFSIITQAEWRNPADRIHGEYEPVTLQLRIVNRSRQPLLFPTFDSFHPVLQTADGKPIGQSGGRDETRITRHLLLSPGQGYSLPLEAKIEYKDRDESVRWQFEDGTGTIEVAALKAGNYLISFELQPTHYDFAKSGKLPAPLWSGTGSTGTVAFKVNPP